jgi:hypothetical protein
MKRIIPFMAFAVFATGAWAQSAPPVASERAPANPALKDPDVQKASVAAEGANSFTEGQAQERIEKAGFSEVSALTKDDAGLWKGTAKRNGKSVKVALDYKGNVTAK